MSQVQFVVRKKDEDIQHWKYIKKEKVNGKMRYYYDEATDAKYANNLTETRAVESMYQDKEGNTAVDTDVRNIEYKDTNRLFSRSETEKWVKNHGKLFGVELNSTDTKTTKERGILERVVARAEKWIFDKFF